VLAVRTLTNQLHYPRDGDLSGSAIQLLNNWGEIDTQIVIRPSLLFTQHPMQAAAQQNGGCG